MMNQPGSIAFRFVILLALCGMFINPGMAQVSSPLPAAQISIPGEPEKAQAVPAEVRARFENGLSIEEFLTQNQGPVPQALRELADSEVTVVIEMEAAPLAEQYAQNSSLAAPMAPDLQRTYLNSLDTEQSSVAAALQSMNGTVIDRYTKAYNGILVRLPVSSLQAVRTLPGVKEIHLAPRHEPNLSHSIPLIKADQVQNSLGIDGSDITIAVIDTGIDYTHAAFGGSGVAEDYENNDPNIIEPDTFPTAKVIGGHDFAGTDYNANSFILSQRTPKPDPDPLDENGHGTHVASIAAGVVVSPTLGPGVAPGAKLYALKIFGAEGSTELTVSAIEWAMDPNQDGDLSDHVDVINLSLGSRYGTASRLDPDIVAADLATRMGIVVVSSAGNNGDVSYITGRPAAADAAISVAASSTGFVTGPTISIVASDVPTLTGVIYQPGNFAGNTGHFTQTVIAPIFYVGELPDVEDDLLCSRAGLPGSALAGTLALIQRGECTFSVKVNNAAFLGAVGAIIFNTEEGGNRRITMGGSRVNIPAGFIPHDAGFAMAFAHGETAIVSAENEVISAADSLPVDTIGDFSSRGPRGLDSFMKPDVTAPGVAIYAAKMGSGNAGVSFDGTSMSSPHVAGVAALILQQHPDWSPEQVKAALMNTAVDLADEASAQVPRQGAGRVDALAAVTAETFAIGDPDRVSLSWGIIPMLNSGYQDQKTITLQNTSTESKVFNLSVEFGSRSLHDGFELKVPSTVEVSGSPGIAFVPVELLIDATKVPVDFRTLEEYYGYVVFTNATDPADVMRVPFYAIPQPHSSLALSGEKLLHNAGEVQITHSGPVTSSLWVYPVYFMDEDEPAQGNQADLRMLGMDYGWHSEDFGPIFVPAINVYGPWFTPQPYFAEFDLYLDVDQNGQPDYANFNYNLGWFNGAGDNDQWIVVQVNLRTRRVFLGSPYLIFTDYNTGYMEWFLPATWNGLNPETNTDFDFQLFSFDFEGDRDESGVHYFDFARPPFGWELTHNPGPENPVANLSFWLKDASGYLDSAPLGLMIVDYAGSPGEGQAYAHQFSIEKPFLGFLSLMTR